MEGEVEREWGGYWATNGPAGQTSCVSFPHRDVMRTRWGTFKNRRRIILPWAQASNLGKNPIVNRDNMLSVHRTAVRSPSVGFCPSFQS